MLAAACQHGRRSRPFPDLSPCSPDCTHCHPMHTLGQCWTAQGNASRSHVPAIVCKSKHMPTAATSFYNSIACADIFLSNLSYSATKNAVTASNKNLVTCRLSRGSSTALHQGSWTSIIMIDPHASKQCLAERQRCTPYRVDRANMGVRMHATLPIYGSAVSSHRMSHC